MTPIFCAVVRFGAGFDSLRPAAERAAFLVFAALVRDGAGFRAAFFAFDLGAALLDFAFGLPAFALFATIIPPPRSWSLAMEHDCR
jgi:hypothetical protein